MGLSGDVVAVGKFNRELLPYLKQPPSFYESTTSSSVVVEVLFAEFGVCGTSSTHQLAEALGVSVWDFSTHRVKPDKVELSQIALLAGEHESAKFNELASRGFRFYFRPNG